MGAAGVNRQGAKWTWQPEGAREDGSLEVLLGALQPLRAHAGPVLAAVVGGRLRARLGILAHALVSGDTEQRAVELRVRTRRARRRARELAGIEVALEPRELEQTHLRAARAAAVDDERVLAVAAMLAARAAEVVVCGRFGTCFRPSRRRC